MYSEKILELFKNPINAGGLQGANGTGKYIDSSCGDMVKIYLKVDENKVISEARFKAMGGVCTIVASSAICSCLLDCTLDEALKIDAERIFEVTGEFPSEKLYAIDIVKNAVKNAIDNYYVQLEKELKKLANRNEEVKKVETKKEKPVITPEIEDRRNISAAKAAFDAMFEI